MTRLLAAATLLALLFPAAATAAFAPARDVVRSDPLRKTLLDTLRPQVERDLGQKIIFVVDVLRTDGEWAFVTAAPRTPAGAPIDFARTRHAERQAEGMLDGDTIYALLRRDARGWKLLSWVIGPTDVAWAGWSEEYGAPEAIFGLPEP